jgi:hypothetical protein
VLKTVGGGGESRRGVEREHPEEEKPERGTERRVA